MDELLSHLYETQAVVFFNLQGARDTLTGVVSDVLDGDVVVLSGQWNNGLKVELVVPVANINFYGEAVK
jgi:hypothetical protein